MLAFMYPAINVLEGGLEEGSFSLICLLTSSTVKSLCSFTLQYSSIICFVSSLILLFVLLLLCPTPVSFISAFFVCSTTLYTLFTPILSTFDICFGFTLSTKYKSRALLSTFNCFSFFPSFMELAICGSSISSCISSFSSSDSESRFSNNDPSSSYFTNPVLILCSSEGSSILSGCSCQKSSVANIFWKYWEEFIKVIKNWKLNCDYYTWFLTQILIKILLIFYFNRQILARGFGVLGFWGLLTRYMWLFVILLNSCNHVCNSTLWSYMLIKMYLTISQISTYIELINEML